MASIVDCFRTVPSATQMRLATFQGTTCTTKLFHCRRTPLLNIAAWKKTPLPRRMAMRLPDEGQTETDQRNL